MATIGIAFMIIYLILGLTAYKELYNTCRNPTDEALVKKFRRKVVIHWAEYAYNVGRIRKVVRENTEGDYKELTTVKFSECFSSSYKRAAKLYADLILSL